MNVLHKNQTGISRRNFLGLCAATTGGAALSMRSFTAKAKIPPKPSSWAYGEVIPSVCNMCVNRCSIRCHVVDGVLEKIDGDPTNPQNRRWHLRKRTGWHHGSIRPGPYQIPPDPYR